MDERKNRVIKNVIKEEIKVPGHIDYLGELRNFVTKTGKKHGFSDSVVNAFKLSIDEAATNIIKHAYRDKEGPITMRVVVKKNSMTVILIDQGKFFDPGRVQNPDLNRYVDIGKKGGLGIFIMRKLIDEIEYRHTEEGNELRLTKYRDGKFHKKELEREELPAPASLLALSLKSKYSLIAAGILTIIIIIGYLYYYITHGNQVVQDILTTEKMYSENIASTVIDPNANTLSIFYIGTHLSEAIEISQYEEIYRVVITDQEHSWLYCTDDKLTEPTYDIPQHAKKVSPDVYRYELKKENIQVYDVVSPIIAKNGDKVGKTHLLVKKDFVDEKVIARHNEDLRLAILILLMGYLGIAVLIYIVMNPFRKLGEWVKELGHGEVKDEIDFDTGDELGEIAKAFSEITDKFRKSQKNLVEQERLQKEMQLAQDIQQTLLPSAVPEIEGYEIASFYAAAKEVGGDYYDFVEVDKDCLGIVVADVSGKGVPGSLIMTMIRTALRTEARGVKSASEVLARLNTFVEKDMKKGMFVTIFYVIIDSKRRRLNYASAGHNPMILYRPTTQKTYYLNPKGFPVGISLPDPELFKKSIESDTIQLAENDILLIYTDGLTEAMNNKRHLFGEERLLDFIRKSSQLRVEPFIEKLREEIHSFTEGYEQNDDITLLAIKEKSTQEKIELQRAQQAHTMILNGKSIREACEESGITTYAYYNKYKRIFEEEGVDAYSIDETVSVEGKHLSIEEKTKIYDIIKKHPEFGAKRISEELNTAVYGFADINENRIYDELVRSRLNTRQLREAFIARAGKKKRMKPPGTPMLTLDGKIIIDKTQYEEIEEPPVDEIGLKKERKPETTPRKKEEREKSKDAQLQSDKPKDFDDDFYIESLMTVPIENLLEKKRKGSLELESTEDDEQMSDELETEKDLQFVDNTINKDETEEEIDDDSFIESLVDEENLNEIDNIEIEAENDAAIDDLIIEESINGLILDETVEKDIADEISENEDEKESYSDEIIGDESFEFEDSTAEELRQKPDEDILAELNEEDEIGLEHDFSFKDIWEDDVVEFEDDEIQQLDDSIIEESKPKTEKEMALFDSDEDNGKLEDDQLSFNDLVDEIEHSISFIDEGKEVATDKNDYSEQNVMKSDHPVEDNEQLDDVLKEKHLLLGLKYYKESNFKKAIDEFKNVIEIYPDFKEVHNILGNAYFRSDMTEQALEAYERVKEIDPADVVAYENIGVIYANWGEYSKAISEWEKLLEIDPQRNDIRNNLEKARNMLEKVNDKV